MVKDAVKWIVFKIIYPVCYHIAALKSVSAEKIVFVENHQDTLSDNYQLLYNRLEELGYENHVHYLQMTKSNWGKIIVHTLQLILDMATARCVFINDSNSMFGSFTLRKETKLIQLWHACGAFKKWGYSVADKKFGDDKKTLDRYSPHRNYSIVPVSGKEVCWAYEEAFGLQKNSNIVVPLGVSRTDVYFEKERRTQAFEKFEKLGLPLNGRKILLYAPTFRGDIKNAAAPDCFDLNLMYQLHEDYVVLIKNHPFVKERMKEVEAYTDFCREITNQLTIEELIMIADVCVTDYSSIVFEYSLMHKPILFLAYDLKEYYDERGFYYSYEEFVPGPIVKTTQELLEKLNTMKEFDDETMERFREQYMSGCDGNATERIIEYALQF